MDTKDIFTAKKRQNAFGRWVTQQIQNANYDESHLNEKLILPNVMRERPQALPWWLRCLVKRGQR